jgi:hypothetical protein
LNDNLWPFMMPMDDDDLRLGSRADS